MPKISKASIWPLFLTTHAVVVAEVEARLSAAGLPLLSWYDVLWALECAERQRLRMSELAQMTVLSRSNLTRLVDRLESAGYVKRAQSEHDRRGAYAVVTAEGRAMRRKMWQVYAVAIKELFEDHIQNGEIASTGNALWRVLQAARDPSLKE